MSGGGTFWEDHEIQSGRITCFVGEIWFHVTEGLDHCPGCGKAVPQPSEIIDQAPKEADA